ncbi:MAG: protein kinase domain-containing protein [Chloroflexota bacterium]
MNQLIGQRIGNYHVDALLGEGGMGSVYRGRHVTLQSTVAIKVMHGHLARQEIFQKRFLQEAQAAARLDHRSVIKVYDFGRRSDLLYMVMAYVSGGSLATYIDNLYKLDKGVQLQEILYLLAQVVDALGYAHRQGVVHRDVKPDNIMLKRLDEPDRAGEPPLRAVVTDFGLAKLLEGGLQTATNTFMGTLPYMSPEQALNRPLDGRSDLYSVGVILYQLATGRLPFEINTPTDAVQKHLHETPPPPSSVRPDIPPMVAAIIEKAIKKDPDDRFQGSSVMAKALRQAASKLTEADVTRFTPVHSVLSLMTQLQPDADRAPVLPTRMEFSEPAQGAELIVARKGMTPRRYPLDRSQLSIGRGAHNDVVLDDDNVSRQHVRLEQTAEGWQVVDLGSTNGTFLGDNRLLADLPEPWNPGQTLRIGPFFLTHRGLEQETGAGPSGTRVGTVDDATRMQVSGGVRVAVNPSRLTLAAGDQGTMQVELVNEGVQVEHYTVQLEGLDAAWLSTPRQQTQLLPGDRATLPITIHVPRHSSARSGRHRFRVQVTSDEGQDAAVPGELTVAPFSQFSVDVQPTHVANGETARVSVHNEGNTPTSFAFVGRDPAEAITFRSTQAQVTVAPGETETVPVTIAARKRPLLGTKRTLPFEITITGEGGEGALSRKQAGQLDVLPVIPPWAPPLLGILLALLCVAGAAGAAYVNNRNARATQTAEALLAGVEAATQTSVAQATQAAQETAQAGTDQATEATALAATALAAGDDDGDGLSNSEEATLGTDPQVADTDGDGLNDGQEVNQYGTDPRNVDHDGDGLPDGAEVHEHGTSPTNPDTDGDGVPDGVEVSGGSDPLQPPTATPPPTATEDLSGEETATAAAAQTATAAALTAAAPQSTALPPSADRYWPSGLLIFSVLCTDPPCPTGTPDVSTPDPTLTAGEELVLSRPTPAATAIFLPQRPSLMALEFDLPDVASDAVLDASLVLNLKSGEIDDVAVQVGLATSQWSEDERQRPDCDFETFPVVEVVDTSPGEHSWDVTEMVQWQREHPAQDHGFCLRLGDGGNRIFYSREAAEHQQPRLMLTYQP